MGPAPFQTERREVVALEVVEYEQFLPDWAIPLL
jgi:hypothetical protein